MFARHKSTQGWRATAHQTTRTPQRMWGIKNKQHYNLSLEHAVVSSFLSFLTDICTYIPLYTPISGHPKHPKVQSYQRKHRPLTGRMPQSPQVGLTFCFCHRVWGLGLRRLRVWAFEPRVQLAWMRSPIRIYFLRLSSIYRERLGIIVKNPRNIPRLVNALREA